MMPVRLEPVAPRSQVKRSTTEPLRSLIHVVVVALISCHKNVAGIFLAPAMCFLREFCRIVLKQQHKFPYTQGCENTMPDLSDLVSFHSGQVQNFY